MALGPIWIAGIFLSSIAAILAGGLLYVYLRNLRQAKTGFTIGLVIFAASLFLENLFAAFIYFQLAQTYTAVLGMPLMFLKAFELTGFAILFWVTLRP